MSVDIDIGGNEFDDLEEEIALVDAEDVEVLDEEVPQEQEVPQEPQRAPPQAVKKPSPWVKRILILIVVVVLVLVGIFAVVYLGTSVSDITVSADPNDPQYPNDLRVEVLVGATGMASIAGEADLEITYDGDVVHSSKISIDDGGSGRKYVPFNSFIEGNGYYYITAKYQGVESPPAEYEVDYLVENLDIGIWDSFNNRYIVDVGVVRQGGQLKGQLNLTTYMLDDKGNYVDDIRAELTVVEIKLEDDPPLIANDELGQVNESFYTEEYTFSQAGNYTITVELENTRVNPDSDSPYRTISETWEGFLNILPVPVVETNIDPPSVGTYKVTFDASDSFNDGDITLYKWDLNNDGDFDDDDEITIGPSTSANYLIGTPFTVTVNIIGDVIDPDTDELEIGSTTVQGP